jgi:hypothetical protein
MIEHAGHPTPLPTSRRFSVVLRLSLALALTSLAIAGVARADCSDSSAGAFLNVTKAKIRASAASAPKGRVSIKGDFVLLNNESFTPTQLTAHVKDGLTFDATSSAATCVLSASQTSLKCKGVSGTGTALTTASFKFPRNTTGNRSVRFSLKIAKLSVADMAFLEPVTLTMTLVGAPNRAGCIDQCRAANGQLVCRVGG